MTIPLRQTLLNICNPRRDEWSIDVQRRLLSCNDLVAEEALYHSKCMVNFRLTSSTENKKGRPNNHIMTDNFEKICNWLEQDSDCELYTLGELYDKMIHLSEGSPCYSKKSLKRKLVECYGDHISFAQQPGQPDLICFRNFSWFIMNEFKKIQMQTPLDIIDAAAKIIKNDIRNMPCTKKEYPIINKMDDLDYGKKWVPESLLVFLKHLVPSPLKQISIGQSITQCSRPRSMIAPIPFGIGVDVDKSFSTRWLVDHLSKFGFSVSSDEVKLFKQSAITQEELNADQTEEPQTDKFAQWAADNVDHNICTLTGKGTFHGMGIISMSSQSTIPDRSIARLKKNEFHGFSNTGVPITPYNGSSKIGLSKLNLKSMRELIIQPSLAPEMSLDLVWQTAWFFQSIDSHRPNWSGFMQHATKHKDKELMKQSIQFLPIIDLDPNDETCIYSTLQFVIKEAARLDIQTPSITFDQPLWQKATGIIKKENMNMVCRLGGFHTLMSFLGSIGKMMAGSGIEELFEEVYAENTVTHMLTGKAYARAIRAHFLAQSALKSHIITLATEKNEIPLSEIEAIYNKVMKDDISEEEISQLTQIDQMKRIDMAMKLFADEIKKSSRTAKLWLQYIDYVDLVKEFIYAERTSDWLLHLQTVKKMANLFAATGHINYARCSRLYVQKMMELPEEHPWLYQQFINGNHAIRRSKRFWAGLWSDLVIEQTMMRSIKSNGGLTRGRGFSEDARHLWVRSINQTASIHEAMTTLSGVKVATSEQHVEFGKKRRTKDFNDCTKFHKWFECRNPFTFEDADLHSLSTGLVSTIGNDQVNAEDSEEIGGFIQQSLDDVPFTEAKIKRKLQLKSLDSLTKTVKIPGQKALHVDPTTLFVRLAAVAQREEGVEDYFDFELTNYPLSLFKNQMMRKPNKATLRNVLLPEERQVTPDKLNSEFVIDGGALLHRVHWSKDMEFKVIGDEYVKYVRRNYGSAFIVFDGYEETLSVKSTEHERRSLKNRIACDVVVKEENQMPYHKERFLSNPRNKSRLISYVSTRLNDDGHSVYICTGDADTMIVSTALDVSKRNATTVVADDTDVAVMLLYHWNESLNDVHFLQERGKKCWSIKEAQKQLTTTKPYLLFIHAWSGCDSTSAIMGKGKPSFYNTVSKSKRMQDLAESISDYWASSDNVKSASIEAFQILYGGDSNVSLKKLR